MNKNDRLDGWKKHIKSMSLRKRIVLAVVLLVGLVWLLGRFSSPSGHEGHDHTASSQRAVKYWTCSMHPQIKLSRPGVCPICAMDLIPVYEGGNQGQSASRGPALTLNEEARRLAGVQTAKVEYKTVSNKVRLVGKVDYDETRLSYISAWVPGRIDRLFVDFTGIRVRKGDHLIQLYSPELISAQEEYIQAIKNQDQTKESTLGVMRDTAVSTLKSVKEKLHLLGISDEQIEAIAKREEVQPHLTIRSPVTGTVIQKNGFEGQYVKTGDRIYTIADLSKVWLFLEAYESDLQWLHYGQDVQVEAEAFPGRVFHGKIAFIDPFVDENTRTVSLRVNVENEEGKLKPGMFMRATIEAELGEGGVIYEEKLAGKWICPMHPEIVKDAKGICDICEMDLIPTSEFGFAEQPVDENRVLVIPGTAPLITGKRAVVYVEREESQGMNLYEGREVVLGPRAGDEYVVLSGLRPGERVVTKGNFKIDSAIQLEAKPSMMNPAEYYSNSDGTFSRDGEADGQDAGLLKEALVPYFEAGEALSRDDPHAAAKSLETFREQLEIILQDQSESGDQLGRWISAMAGRLQDVDHDLDSLRTVFAHISNTLKDILEQYDYREDMTPYRIFCPMAFEGQGGTWIQNTDVVANPYFGAAMLDCGNIEGSYGRQLTPATPPMNPGHQH